MSDQSTNNQFTYWDAVCNYSESTIDPYDRLYSALIFPDTKHGDKLWEAILVPVIPNQELHSICELSEDEAFMYLLFFHWMETIPEPAEVVINEHAI